MIVPLVQSEHRLHTEARGVSFQFFHGKPFLRCLHLYISQYIKCSIFVRQCQCSKLYTILFRNHQVEYQLFSLIYYFCVTKLVPDFTVQDDYMEVIHNEELRVRLCPSIDRASYTTQSKYSLKEIEEMTGVKRSTLYRRIKP